MRYLCVVLLSMIIVAPDTYQGLNHEKNHESYGDGIVCRWHDGTYLMHKG